MDLQLRYGACTEHVRRYHKRGLAGIVTDGGCRDVGVMEEVGLPVFSRGTCLYGPGGFIRPVASDVPVVCGGVQVRPGDVVAADVDGVLVVPKEALSDLARVKPDLEKKEDAARQMIEQGASLSTAYPLSG